MDGVLQSLDLGNLSDRFRAERVELKTVIAATDQELIRLGVATIGDRIRLRGACEKTVSETESTTSSQSNTVREERLALFAPRRNNSRNQARVTARHAKRSAKGNPWTPSFVCMADSVSSKTPTSMEKQILFKAGLGVKKIKLDMDDDEQAVFTKITCDEKVLVNLIYARKFAKYAQRKRRRIKDSFPFPKIIKLKNIIRFTSFSETQAKETCEKGFKTMNGNLRACSSFFFN